MPYCTLEKIKSIIPEKELINLTVDNPRNDSVIDENCLNECIKAADSLIDGYIRAKYSLPLSHVPAFIATIAADITAYRLYMRRPKTMPDHIKANYETALKQLLQIKKGDLLLETPQELPDDAQMPEPAPTFLVKSSPRIFSDGLLRKYGI